MCVICDGGSEEELLSDEFVRIALHGFVMVAVEPAPTWAYTIGLLQSFDHPELVVTGLPDDSAAHVMTGVVDRIREGERFTASSPPVSLCDCTTAAFGAVHPAQWEQGRFDQWLRFYGWVGGEAPVAQAVLELPASVALPPSVESPASVEESPVAVDEAAAVPPQRASTSAPSSAAPKPKSSRRFTSAAPCAGRTAGTAPAATAARSIR